MAVFAVILGFVLYLLAPPQAQLYLRELINPNRKTSAVNSTDTASAEPMPDITYLPRTRAEDDFEIDDSVRPPDEYSYYHQYLTGQAPLDFNPTLRLCQSVLGRIQSDYVDEISTSTLMEGARNEIAMILEESGFSRDSLDDMASDESFFKGVADAYSHRIDQRILFYACIRGMIEGLQDNHCEFLSPAEYEEFLERTHQSKYFGIGIRIVKDRNTEHVKIMEVFKEGPAQKAGLLEEDLITDIDGKPVKGESLEQVSNRIKGEENTPVTLSILRGDEALTVKIIRGRIVVHSVHEKVIGNRIGYIRIDSFKEELDEEFRRAYSSLEGKEISALVLDLRNNPGGLVSSAQQLCGAFLPRGSLIATFRHRDDKERRIHVRGRRVVFIPVVVLVNEHTASSSEIAAGSLKDHGIAVIIGTRTRGKGSVQRTWRLAEGAGIKLTIEKIYTPKGFSINNNGILPDIAEGSPPGFNFEDEDAQLDRALSYLRSKGYN